MNSVLTTNTWGIYLQIGSIVIALVTALLAVIQYIRKNKLKKAGQLHEIVNRMWSDQDICDVIYKAEEPGFTYDALFYKSGLEYKTDKTLEYLSYFCYLKERHLISSQEFAFLEYRIRTVLSNPGIQQYLYNLYHYTRRRFYAKEGDEKLGKHYLAIKAPFYYLIKYGNQNGLLKEHFFDMPSSYEYIIESLI